MLAIHSGLFCHIKLLKKDWLVSNQTVTALWVETVLNLGLRLNTPPLGVITGFSFGLVLLDRAVAFGKPLQVCPVGHGDDGPYVVYVDYVALSVLPVHANLRLHKRLL